MSQRLLHFLRPAPAQFLQVFRDSNVRPSVSSTKTKPIVSYCVTRRLSQTATIGFPSLMTSKNRVMCAFTSLTNKGLLQVTRKQCWNSTLAVVMCPISSFSLIANNRLFNGNDNKSLLLCNSKALHSNNNTYFLKEKSLLTIEPVHLISHRFIRYKAQFQSQHQDQTKTTKTATDNNNSSTEAKDTNKVNESEFTPTVPPEKPSLYQRFKQTYKQHGKIFIIVHLCTSAAWFSSLYLAVRSGLDIVPYLEKFNFSEKVISPFRAHGGAGDIALTLLMYKLIVPARYATTLGVVNLVIKYLRKEGKMKEIPQEDRLRSLYQESKENIKLRSKLRIKKMQRKSKSSKGPKQNGI